MSPNFLGALLMMGSMAAFTFNDTLVKVIGGQLPLFQIISLRGLLATSLIFLLARTLGKLRFNLQRRDWGLVAARCASEIGATYCFLAALMIMPIANITAVLQALPLTVTLGAAVFLGEEVGWRRMAAILLGFCGVLLIVRPGPDGFSEGALYALLAVAFVTARDLTTRRMSSEVPSLTVTLLASISVTVFALICSLGVEWEPVSLSQVMLLAGAAVFILGGYSLSVMVMRVGEISFVSPFRYTGLIWAILLGWLVFGDWPDGLTLLGAVIVVGTGLFTVIRERRQAQAAQKPV
ncbi:MAG: DMT family transporter [Rhodobacteraceae bacterium]|nr:DMT family transporter [Paracoccaceae bacterium]